MTAKETEFFCDIVTSTLKHRKESKTRRNDLIDMLSDAMKGDLKQEDKNSLPNYFSCEFIHEESMIHELTK